ncbi:anti-sigma factor domain-containing protein [Deinococcus aquiradiocola]|uniref:Regulator of SigK n=1 Tax=Deinococcus aquiradiocola TaxID=393059 RepID=A0A917P6Y4_9DEIO|nr:anti-sigma factor [Deinococcus aquiradiocola]GGJ64312.1 hypothetical protein GCM10008939_05270 [Deinococcus aquiradiocola]
MLDRHQLTSDLLADYALGFLSPEEAAEVEAALDLHPQAREELNAYLNGLTDLVMDLGPSPVPDGAEDRLMARLNADLAAPTHTRATAAPAPQAAAPAPTPLQVPARRPWLYPVLAVAAAAALAVVLLPTLRGTPHDLAYYQRQPGSVTTPIRTPAGQTVAQVVRLTDGHAYVRMQASVPSGRAYQAWKIENGKPVSLGLFKGQNYVAALPAGTVFAVTVEPETGSDQPTTTPLFANAI